MSLNKLTASLRLPRVYQWRLIVKVKFLSRFLMVSKSVAKRLTFRRKLIGVSMMHSNVASTYAFASHSFRYTKIISTYSFSSRQFQSISIQIPIKNISFHRVLNWTARVVNYLLWVFLISKARDEKRREDFSVHKRYVR